MTEDKYQKLKQLLLEEHVWPGPYTFKCIVPVAQLQRARGLFAGFELSEKPSKTGKYVSLTAYSILPGPDDVIRYYRDAQDIEGIVLL